jgi:hypothetical protein
MNLSEREWRERERVIALMGWSRTLAEVEAANAALDAWIDAHPEDIGIRDGGELLFHSEEFAREREAVGVAMGLSEPERRERERIHVQALRAGGEVENIVRARQELLLWRWHNPEDVPHTDHLMDLLNQEETFALVLAETLAEAGDTMQPHNVSIAESSMIATAQNQPQPAAVAVP